MIALLGLFGFIWLLANAPQPQDKPTTYNSTDWKTIQQGYKYILTNQRPTKPNTPAHYYLYYHDNEGYEVKEPACLYVRDKGFPEDLELPVTIYFKDVKDHKFTKVIAENGSYTKIIPSTYKPTTPPELTKETTNPHRLKKQDPFHHDSQWIKKR